MSKARKLAANESFITSRRDAIDRLKKVRIMVVVGSDKTALLLNDLFNQLDSVVKR